MAFKEYWEGGDYSHHQADAFQYMLSARKNGKTMGMYRYNEIRDRMEHLRHCGCSMCRSDYQKLERELYDSQYSNYQRDAYLSYKDCPPMIAIPSVFVEPKKEMKPVQEPKNYAVKLLVDQLKAQQTTLDAKKKYIENDKNMIKSYQTQLKTNNTEKLAIENKIKELSVALKKLGHKE